MNLKRSRTEEANQAPMSRTHAFQSLAVNIAQVLGNKAHTQPVSEGKKSDITDFKEMPTAHNEIVFKRRPQWLEIFLKN